MDNYTFEEVQGFYNKLTDRVKQSVPGIELKKKIDEMGMVSVGGVAPTLKRQLPVAGSCPCMICGPCRVTGFLGLVVRAVYGGDA